MELVFKNAKNFKSIIDSLSVLVDQGEFLVSSDGMSLRAADQAMIAMVDFSLPKTAFKVYDVSGDTKLGLDLENFSKILSRARSEDELSLSLSEDNATLKVGFKGKAARNFTLPLLDLSQEQLPTPNIEFSAKITVLADLLQDGLKDAALFNTYVSLSAEDKKFRIDAKGTSGGKLDFELTSDDEALKDLQVKEASKASFSLDYLQNILKSASKESVVTLSLKENAPVLVSYSIDEAELKYFVAPRAENE